VSNGNLRAQRTHDRGGHGAGRAPAIFVGWAPLYHDQGLIGNVLQPLHLGSPAVLMAPNTFLQGLKHISDQPLGRDKAAPSRRNCWSRPGSMAAAIVPCRWREDCRWTPMTPLGNDRRSRRVLQEGARSSGARADEAEELSAASLCIGAISSTAMHVGI